MEIEEMTSPAQRGGSPAGSVPGCPYPFLPVLGAYELKQTDPLVHAYVGDAVYELFVRISLSRTPVTNTRMHLQAVSIVNAQSQQRAYRVIRDSLTREEADVFRRGRNASGHAHPRHASPMEYADATGLEALFGWLWLGGGSLRAWELFELIWSRLEEVAADMGSWTSVRDKSADKGDR